MNPDEMLNSVFSEWMEAILEESEKEKQEENEIPVHLLDLTNRKNIWHACISLKVNIRGIPGAACRIMESYIARHLRKFAGTEQWERVRNEMINRFYLLLFSCIQLAAKMTATLECIDDMDVQKVLRDHGFYYTKQEIRNVEFHVFQTIGFHLPMWTNVETAEFLAKTINVKQQNVIIAVNLVTEIADASRNYLEQYIHSLNERNAPLDTTGLTKKTISHIHLCAGAVVTALRYMAVPVGNKVTRLAALTRTTVTYLENISDGIMKKILSIIST